MTTAGAPRMGPLLSPQGGHSTKEPLLRPPWLVDVTQISLGRASVTAQAIQKQVGNWICDMEPRFRLSNLGPIFLSYKTSIRMGQSVDFQAGVKQAAGFCFVHGREDFGVSTAQFDDGSNQIVQFGRTGNVHVFSIRREAAQSQRVVVHPLYQNLFTGKQKLWRVNANILPKHDNFRASRS